MAQPRSVRLSFTRRALVGAAALVMLAATVAVAAPAAAAPANGHGSPSGVGGSRTHADSSWDRTVPILPQNAPEAGQLVQSVLGRQATTPELEQLGGQLDQGATAAQVAQQLSRSTEFVQGQVRAAYLRLLRRGPTAQELATWTAKLQSGTTVESMTAAIIGTPEYARRNGRWVGFVVFNVYRDILNRPPRPIEWLIATLEIAFHHQTVGGLATELLRSHEHAVAVVNADFRAALFRAPTDAELAGFTAKYEAGQTDQVSLLVALAGSPEAVAFGCDPMVPSRCLLPFPNNYFTTPDRSTPTGLRVNVKASFAPASTSGAHVDLAPVNRSDGFSPGSQITLQVPGVDLAKSGAPPVDNIGVSLQPNSPVVVIDAQTGERWPVWAEVDSHATTPADQAILIHPAKNFLDGHTYVVALRNLDDSAGATLPAPPVFAAYRDGRNLPTVGGFEARKPHMEQIFRELRRAGVSRGDLYLAWDFTVASTQNITQRELHIRDDAFSRIGNGVPTFQVTSVQPGNNPGIARVVQGTYQIPSYLTGSGGPGSTFNYGPNGLPAYSGNSITEPFLCTIPDQAMAAPAPSTLYGHGLFGNQNEVASSAIEGFASSQGFVMCATKWIGMSDEDVPTVVAILQNLSLFPTLPDRLQQGLVDFQFLARLLNSPQGFVADPAFQSNGKPVIQPNSAHYLGGSQGGIEGGALTAVATEFARSVLVVPAMNYGGLLLQRSVDFDPFQAILQPNYPSALDQVIGLDLIQMMWDRGEPDGYANHMVRDLLPGTPPHQVTIAAAFGDHQVSNIATDVEARTLSAQAHCPPLAPGRSPGQLTLWNVPCIQNYPFTGPASITYWDSGSNAPPLTNTAPPENVPGIPGHDPHGDISRSPKALDMGGTFLRTGQITNLCGNAPCTIP